MHFYIKSCKELYLENSVVHTDSVFTKKLKELGNPDVPVLMSITKSQVDKIGDERIRNEGFTLIAATRNPNTGRTIHHYVRLPDQ